MMKSKIQPVTRVNYEQVSTTIGSDVFFVGNITNGESIRFEGNLKGNINISGNLIVGRNALITGDIVASNVHVMGNVEGTIKCEQLKILATGRLTGDAEFQKIIIDEGGTFIGHSKTLMGSINDAAGYNDVLNNENGIFLDPDKNRQNNNNNYEGHWLINEKKRF